MPSAKSTSPLNCGVQNYRPSTCRRSSQSSFSSRRLSHPAYKTQITRMELDYEPMQEGIEEDGRELKKGKGKAIIVILVGAPGSGKSTFCDTVMRASSRPWVRVCQDIINNGKAGTKAQCLSRAASAVKDGKSVFIDRCNLEKEQRADFVKLSNPHVDVHAVVLDFPAQICISRSVKRTGHEGKLQGGKAAAVVNRMLQKKELPKLNEGFYRITFCQKDSDVEDAIKAYSSLGPSDTLPSGCFGQKSADAKIQSGIMKFLKKVDRPAEKIPDQSSTPGTVANQMAKENPADKMSDKHITKNTVANQITNEKHTKSEEVEDLSLHSNKLKKVNEGEECKPEYDGANAAMGGADRRAHSSDTCNDPPTLAFPSISTADFQFDLDKASEIIVEKVQEFLDKLGNARLVLVDLSQKSRILSLVKAKAAEKNIDPNRFFTFVGDITCLSSKGGLRCNVIANATNWRLKPGGGGVNAAIFNAAGPTLEIATKERANTLVPGKALVVPLPSNSPLFSKEGVSHVVHVLGPNMNPRRPDYLDNNYVEGCRILRETYSSLFEGFASVVYQSRPSGQQEHLQGIHCASDQKTKRESTYSSEKSKKWKGNAESSDGRTNHDGSKTAGCSGRAWGSWAQALYRIAMHPEKHKDDLLEISNEVVVLNDMYPKARRHILVLARLDGLDRLADVHKEHLELLMTMHQVGVRWAKKFLQDDASLIFRLGYHSTPSMRQLHLHVISQDFDSPHLKNKKHWNSFNTAFFQDSVDVIEEVNNSGQASIQDDERLLSMELRCHRCRSAHPNIPRLKSHIKNCQAPFHAMLHQNDRLVWASTEVCSE